MAVEEGLLPHERSQRAARPARRRAAADFRGHNAGAAGVANQHGASTAISAAPRKLTVPSPFLMELPRGEMDVQDLCPAGSLTMEEEIVDEESGCHVPRLRGHVDVAAATANPDSRPPSHADASVGHGTRLTTAAHLANGGPPLAPASPDVFEHGMLVLHPEYGLGRIVAISGSGRDRKATVDFTAAGRKKFLLYASALHPVDKPAGLRSPLPPGED